MLDLLCLPTPLTLHKTPDLSFVSNAISRLNFLKKKQTIILESTTYPGTTEEYLIEELKITSKLVKIYS